MSIETQQNHALILLRIVVAILLFVHGVARIYLGIVDDFGGFFASINIPFGFYLAWAITIFEIVGSLLLAIGYFITPISIIFAIHLTFGIFLVHLKKKVGLLSVQEKMESNIAFY